MLSNFLRRKIFFVVAGIVIGLGAFSVRYFVAQKDSLARISIPKRTIEIRGPDMQERTLSVNDLEPLSLSSKISEAVSLLKDSPPLGTEQYIAENLCFNHRNNSRALRKEISFAILDKKTHEVFEKRCWYSKEDAEETNIFEKLSTLFGLKPKESEDEREEKELSLVVNWWNNHNSDIEVKSMDPNDEPGRFIVIGNKYPMLNSHLAYPEDRTGKKYSDIVYVPYSGAIHVQELIDEGRNFLNEKVNQAFDELRKEKVLSVSYPNELIADSINPTFVKNIFLTEQTDPGLIMIAQDGGKALAQRVLIRLGANKEKAFRYTFSSVGALGLGQIMPGTYNNIRRTYPLAGLIKDTDIGRVDIVNGIKATILVFDDHFASVLRKLNETKQGQQALSKKSPKEIEEMRAAIYNGGPGKIISQTAQISSAVSETVNFVAKFKKIRALELFN